MLLQYYLWKRLFFFPPKRFRLIGDITPESFKIPFEPFEVDSADGTKIRGWFIKGKKKGKTIIVCHGVTSSRYFHLPRSIYFYYLGYNLCLFDLRAHGHSEGQQVTFGRHEPDDIHAVVQYVKNRRDVGKQELALIAHSMGAASGILYCARHPDVFSAFVCISSYAEIEKDLQYWVPKIAKYPRYPFLWFAKILFRNSIGVDFFHVNPIDHVDQVKCPIFFIHGDRDEINHVNCSKRLYDKANPPKDLWIVTGSNHEGVYEIAGREFESRLATFFKQYFAH